MVRQRCCYCIRRYKSLVRREGCSTLLDGCCVFVCGTHIGRNPGPILPLIPSFSTKKISCSLRIFSTFFLLPWFIFVYFAPTYKYFEERGEAEDKSFIVAVCMFIYIGPPQESEDMPNANTSQVFANKNINYFVCLIGCIFIICVARSLRLFIVLS